MVQHDGFVDTVCKNIIIRNRASQMDTHIQIETTQIKPKTSNNAQEQSRMIDLKTRFKRIPTKTNRVLNKVKHIKTDPKLIKI